MSSFRIRNRYRENDAQYSADLDMGDRFWQPKYYSYSDYSQRKREEKQQHIHWNPIRAALAERAAKRRRGRPGTTSESELWS